MLRYMESWGQLELQETVSKCEGKESKMIKYYRLRTRRRARM